MSPTLPRTVRRSAVTLAWVAPLVSSCSRREPPSPPISPSVATAELSAPAPRLPDSSAPPPRASLAAPAPPRAPEPDASRAANGAGEAQAQLPQTRDMPQTSGAAFATRVQGLWQAIALDDPDRAMPFFFPLGAYVQVKDVGNPTADWKYRLVAAYVRDIHALHARLGHGTCDGRETSEAGRCRFIGIDVPSARARWVEPGEEYNKIGYYRVFGSKLRYEVDGERREFDLKSLISWRGEWYVVHLSAI